MLRWPHRTPHWHFAYFQRPRVQISLRLRDGFLKTGFPLLPASSGFQPAADIQACKSSPGMSIMSIKPVYCFYDWERLFLDNRKGVPLNTSRWNATCNPQSCHRIMIWKLMTTWETIEWQRWIWARTEFEQGFIHTKPRQSYPRFGFSPFAYRAYRKKSWGFLRSWGLWIYILPAAKEPPISPCTRMTV